MSCLIDATLDHERVLRFDLSPRTVSISGCLILVCQEMLRVDPSRNVSDV